MPKLDIEAIVVLIVGAVLGTLVKSATRPEASFRRWAVQAFIAFAVGVVVGGAIIEYFNLGGFMAAAAACGCALISEEIVKGVQANGRRWIGRGRIPFTRLNDDD